MPWELGYFDGYNGKVAIVPISNSVNSDNVFEGQEYLGLYPYMTKGTIVNTTDERLWIHESPRKYVTFEEWLNDIEPQERD